MKLRNEEEYQKKKEMIMEKCYDCYAENGLHGTGVKALGKACGFTAASLYTYFEDLDDLIIRSTEYCMSKVEDEFMEKAPTDAKDIHRFIEEVPAWTAREHGKKFVDGVNERYTAYAKQLELKLGIPYTVITPLIFIFVRACVHYAMFEDEYYLKNQMEVLKQGVNLFVEKYKTEYPKLDQKGGKTE